MSNIICFVFQPFFFFSCLFSVLYQLVVVIGIWDQDKCISNLWKWCAVYGRQQFECLTFCQMGIMMWLAFLNSHFRYLKWAFLCLVIGQVGFLSDICCRSKVLVFDSRGHLEKQKERTERPADTCITSWRKKKQSGLYSGNSEWMSRRIIIFLLRGFFWSLILQSSFMVYWRK